jgi:hypothetical protein
MKWYRRLRIALRLWWNRLWVREDEFHTSLDLDYTAMANMTLEDQSAHQADVIRRREIAHQRERSQE